MTIIIDEEHKKRLLFIALIFLTFLFLTQIAYAKYKKYAEVKTNTSIARWNIKVNNEAISNKTTLQNIIVPTIESSDYTKEGVLAPGSKGYFDIDINAAEVDVDFDYVVDITKRDEHTINDLKITKYKINDGPEVLNSDDNFTGTIIKGTESTKIRIHFEWIDGIESETMDNSTDTTAAQSTDSNGSVNVNINLTQKRASS